MPSIRLRLTAWNAGVLLVIVCALLLSSYLFVRYVSLEQVRRALDQEKAVVASTVASHANQHAGRDALLTALISDLQTHGLAVSRPPDAPTTIVATPAFIDEDDRVPSRDVAAPTVDWRDLATKLAAQKDDDDPFNVRGPHGTMRVLAWRADVDSMSLTLVAAQPFHGTHELLETARDAALVALPVALLISLLTGYALARRALDPVAAMTAEARRIGARNVHERLSVRNPDDELGQLALAFNEVLGRVDSALEQQRRFTADASHELRTPVALIRAEAEVALSSGDATDGEYRAALEATRDGSRQLSRIVEDLFLLARADAGQTLVVPQQMRLDDMVRSTIQSLRPLADAKGIALETRPLPVVVYRGDEGLLRRALANLVDNAIKYSSRGARVEIKLEPAGDAYVITVTDSGPGIAPKDQPHLFERFYRGDSSRAHAETAASAGAGLGLAIARDVAELHGGTLSLRHSTDTGSVFEIRLPADQANIIIS